MSPAPEAFPGPETGSIDVHSHLLPGIDDGCRDIGESLESVRRLQQAGYAGTICTPHIWPETFPANTAENIRQWTRLLQQRLEDEGLDYPIWPGGEVRLFDGVIDWFEKREVPTLAGTRWVLTDMWEDAWPKWADAAFDWLLEHDYKPILAHPERLNVGDLNPHLDDLMSRGVTLQGNFLPMTGEDGFIADRRVREYLSEGRYGLLALDMHRPDSLESRLDGLELVRQEFGDDIVRRGIVEAPRELILAEVPAG
ncbi:MAG: tyrosine-protein phosphatase [Phycisphaeraceae bacterium]